MPGVAEYVEQGGLLVPKLPTPDMCSGGAGGLVVPLAVAGLAAAGAAAYLLFFR